MPKPVPGPSTYDYGTPGSPDYIPAQITPQPRPVVPNVSSSGTQSQQFVGPTGLLAPTTNVNNQSAPAPIAAAAPTAPTSPTVPMVVPDTQASTAAPRIASTGFSSSSITPGTATASVPSMGSAIQSAYDKASKAYEDSLKLSPEELSTQEDLDKLITSTKRAYTDIEDKPIAMQFITGQLSSVERRANTLAEPLERKLARMQASRLASVEASKFGLEQASTRLSEARADDRAAKTDAESARRFEVEQASAAETRALAEKRFAQDQKEFGMTYALQQQQLRQTAANKAAEVEKVDTEKSQAALGTANLVNQLLQGDYEGITGGLFGKSILTRLGTTNQKETNLFKQIQGQLALGARQLVKGSGAISDFEAKTLQEAASALGTNLKNEDFKDALVQIRGALLSNTGQAVNVELTDPETGKSQVVSTNRDGIGSAIKDGLVVKYK